MKALDAVVEVVETAIVMGAILVVSIGWLLLR
jgi:hypothetical protein